MNQVVGRWKDLQDKCKGMINLLDELKEFHDTNDTLNNWLNSKARMMNVLGPIASDPRLVQNQMSQIAVMREDFNEKTPTHERLNELGEMLLENTGDTPDGRRIGKSNFWSKFSPLGGNCLKVSCFLVSITFSH